MHTKSMSPFSARQRALIAVILCLLLLSSAALAAPNVNIFNLQWWTANYGGTTNSQSGEYSLSATAGQPDATYLLISGVYTLQPGFWTGSSRVTKLYLPLVRR